MERAKENERVKACSLQVRWCDGEGEMEGDTCRQIIGERERERERERDSEREDMPRIAII